MSNRFFKLFLAALLFSWNAVSSTAQRHQTYDDHIQSLTVIADDDWQSLPIYTLGEGNVQIEFDDLTHEYCRYNYRLEHCKADWTPSEQLFESDYCRGFADGLTIDSYEFSNLTNTLYTHYSLTIPNEYCQPTISGNYRIIVYDDNDDDKKVVLTACFMVLEPEGKQMGVSIYVDDATDATIRTAHQQVTMTLGFGPYTVTNAEQQIHTVLLQNRQWHDARVDIIPQYKLSDGLKWEHNRNYIFSGGNEYRKFEILSTDVASMGIDRLMWDGANYHAFPYTALPRPNYLYDEDADGAFLLRNSDNYLAKTESDYINVHFLLDTPQEDGDIYINGDWTQDWFLPKYKLEKNEDGLFETIVPLKLGYYNYQYLLVKNGKASYLPSEGCFYQTENKYEALVYFRYPGDRTDRLVGYGEGQYIKQ